MMTTLISKRHFYKFYLLIVLVAIFFAGMGTFILYEYYHPEKIKNINSKELMPIFSFGCYAFAIYTVYRYFKNSPRIILNKDSISFNKERYPLSDIAKMELTGKKPFRYFMKFPMEGASLIFKNGKTKYIYDDMYENTWELKLFLKEVVIDKKDFIENKLQSISQEFITSDFYDTYKDNQITSLRGICLWGMIGLIAYLLINNTKTVTAGLLIFFLCFSLFWFIAFSYQMNYFKISSNYLLVLNTNLFWKKKIYKISDIQEIVFETQGKMPNCLRVITTDFRNKLYPAGTLRDKTWLELKSKLETYNIKVRNECIRDEKVVQIKRNLV